MNFHFFKPRNAEAEEQKFGFQGSIDDVKNVWSGLARNWGDRHSPWRPSAGDISIYQKFGGDSIRRRTLILGATPELRDLVARSEGRVLFEDICSEMVYQANKFLIFSKPEDEKWVSSDWCHSPFPNDHFDLIMGDFIWWLLSVKRQTTLRDELFRLLKPSGVFVSRIHFCNVELLKHGLKEIIESHLTLVLSDCSNQSRTREVLISRLFDATSNLNTQRLDIEKAIPVIEDMINRTAKQGPHHNFLEDLLRRCKGRANWTSQTREQALNSLNKKFSLVAESTAPDYEDARFFPIMKFIKK